MRRHCVNELVIIVLTRLLLLQPLSKIYSRFSLDGQSLEGLAEASGVVR
jgi:hypothetical protein